MGDYINYKRSIKSYCWQQKKNKDKLQQVLELELWLPLHLHPEARDNYTIIP